MSLITFRIGKHILTDFIIADSCQLAGTKLQYDWN